MIATLLFKELRSRGLIPTRERYRLVRGEVTRLGQQEIHRIEGIVGSRTWRRALACLEREYPVDDMVRVLGFGALMGSYIVAGVPFRDGASRTRVVELATLANLIVTLFDEFVDTGFSRSILSPATLKLVASKSPRRLALTGAYLRGPSSRMLVRLVASYFSRLEALRFASQRHELFSFMLVLISQMYEAESNTIAEIGSYSDRDLTRKAALPFVVMGLPAWLESDEFNLRAFREHFRWLFRLGLFIGQIDDAVDLHKDIKAGQPNRLGNTAKFDSSQRFTEKRIACLGERVQLDWLTQRIAAQHVTEDALRVCITSWFGGIPHSAS